MPLFRDKKRIVIFGCGQAGQDARRRIRHRDQIVCFVDNDVSLHGTKIDGVDVCSPETLRSVSFDQVLVASMFSAEIVPQLTGQLDISREKIQLLHEQTSVRNALRSRRIPTTRDDLNLLRLRNRHRGKRVFVIGNGPSLRMEDLEILSTHRELCLASNKIFLAFNSTSWRPDFYGIQDPGIAENHGEEICAGFDGVLFLADYLKRQFGAGGGRAYFRLLPPVNPPSVPQFSRNLLQGVGCGRTITYPLLQLAAWLGCDEAYLLGVDFSYKIGAVFPDEKHKGMEAYLYDGEAQRNYFIDDYHEKGQALLRPYLEHQLRAYQSAEAWCQKIGQMSIFNATRGGELEVFRRVDFDSLFK